MMTEPLRILVADDEPLASERLNLLRGRVEGVTVVGTAQDGTEAIALAEQSVPDVVMLDIAMPGLDGIEVARALSRLPRSPAVVFVTAYDQFAVAAFEVAAVDYLMKPADATRLDRALDRARTFLVQRGPVTTPSERDTSRYLDEFWASDLSGLVRIAARDIDRVSAERDYMRLHVGKRSWLIHHSMAALEDGLDPALFVRLHRSAIVRRDLVTGLRREENGGWFARLADGSEQKVGRLYLHNARGLAGR